MKADTFKHKYPPNTWKVFCNSAVIFGVITGITSLTPIFKDYGNTIIVVSIVAVIIAVISNLIYQYSLIIKKANKKITRITNKFNVKNDNNQGLKDQIHTYEDTIEKLEEDIFDKERAIGYLHLTQNIFINAIPKEKNEQVERELQILSETRRIEENGTRNEDSENN